MVSSRKGYRSSDDFLREMSLALGSQRCLFQRVPQHFQEEAMQWHAALLPILGRQHEVAPGDYSGSGSWSASEYSTGRFPNPRGAGILIWRFSGIGTFSNGAGWIFIWRRKRSSMFRIGPVRRWVTGDMSRVTGGLERGCQPIAPHPGRPGRDFEALGKTWRGPRRFDYTFSVFLGSSRTRKALVKWFKRKQQALRAKGGDLNMVKDVPSG